MSADNNIDQPLFQILNGLFHLCRRAETRHQINSHWKILHPLYEGIVMLLSQDRCRNQIYYLFPVLNGLKGCPQGNLRFSVPYIAANQPIHNLSAFHVSLCGLNRLQLIIGLLIGKQLLKFLLPDGILFIRKTAQLLSGCIQLHQISRNLPDSSFHPCLRPVPLFSAQLI